MLVLIINYIWKTTLDEIEVGNENKENYWWEYGKQWIYYL